MSGSLLDSILIVLILLNFFELGTSRLRALIQGVTLQGVLLGLMPLLVHEHVTTWVLLLAAATLLLKGLIIPRMLLRAIRNLEIRQDIEPIIGLGTTLMLAAVGTALAVVFAWRLPLAGMDGDRLLVTTSLSMVLTGFLVLTTRIKAITQVAGYLILENGIFVFGLLLLEPLPFLVEVGVLLDLFVGIFVMGIIMNHISREFASVDTDRLSALKE